MRRYWLPQIQKEDSQINIEGDYFHHICEVCRQGAGSRFEVLTEDGWALLVEVTTVGKRSAQAQVIESRKIPTLPTPHIHLALSVPKMATLEAVVEKSVELGVKKIWPFFSDYSFVRTQKSVLESKKTRLEKIIRGATQQSGRGDLMEFAEAMPLAELLPIYQKTAARGVFAYEGQGGSLSEALRGPSLTPAKSAESVWIFVGSEGGFSHQEVDTFKNINLFPVSLGQQVLRVETACVTLLSIIKYELELF
jgi:16S rRNA (uracil1498-N3)-methyltransferase